MRQVDAKIAAEPKVSGGEPYLSRSSNDVLQKALDIAKKQGDEICHPRSFTLSHFTVNSPASTILRMLD